MEKKYCNCAECGKEAVGMSCSHLAESDERIIRGHIKGRPWCGVCLNWRRIPGGRSTKEDDGSPGQSNAIRAMEGD